jgi:hypothetical protein
MPRYIVSSRLGFEVEASDERAARRLGSEMMGELTEEAARISTSRPHRTVAGHFYVWDPEVEVVH